ncbi:MAG: carbamoyltransferase C-terminal domain-containing protein [Pseudomonadota bacterium]
MAKILGFGGLPGITAKKQRHIPDLSSRELNISQGADTAAALLIDGHLVAAAAEERFDGQKHSRAFPAQAIDYCLSAAGLSVSDLDYIAHPFDFSGDEALFADQSQFHRELFSDILAPDRVKSLTEKHLGVDLSGRFVPVRHHLAHAETAFAPSGFEEALVVVSDGVGERHSASVYIGNKSGLERITSISATNSLGIVYGLVTMYLGFEFGDGEYKVMGLAPFGDVRVYREQFAEHCVRCRADGHYDTPILLQNSTAKDKETFRAALAEMERIFGPRRLPGEQISQRHKDIAAALQKAMEAAHFNFIAHYQKETGIEHLCLAGGVALNCVANGLLLRSRRFKDIFVQPAAGDDGAAMGAALSVARGLDEPVSVPAGSSFGPGCDPLRAVEHPDHESQDFDWETYEDEDTMVSAVADRLANGEIIGWCQGRMEFGPRALGYRSILADPRPENMQSRINQLIKKREGFRPFAPAVPVEKAEEYFEIDPDEAHVFANMLFVAYVRENYRKSLPAATHIDGSARVQTVDPRVNPLFWKLLHMFDQKSGIPILLNTCVQTSFEGSIQC